MSALRVSDVVSRVRVMVGSREFALTWHVVERFRERVRPDLGVSAARRELGRLLAGAEISLTVPDWARGRLLVSHHPHAWLGIESELLLFPVEHGRVLTCYAQERVGAQIRIVRR